MGRHFEAIDADLAEWIRGQRLFFVATAPLDADGHVNCSPKGLDTLRILGPRRVAYLDLTGSGAETIAHLRENGRIVIMLCAFEGAPRILRLHGRGRPVVPGESGWDELADEFPPLPGARSIVVIEVDRIADSCGFGVPRYAAPEDRDTLTRWAESKGEVGVAEYRREKNALSIDGLPALDPG